MSKLIINGGKKLSGTIRPVPNKNSILKLIPAAVLTDEDVHISNVPGTSDVKYMLEIFEQLGGKVEWTADDAIKLNASTMDSYTIDPELSQKMKASVMYSGPLLVRFGRVSMPSPQGCKLGTRPMDTFMENIKELGAEYEYVDGNYDIVAKNLKGEKVWQWFPSVTGTENLILMAVMTPGKTEIYNAACEPHTQDLCNMLVSMGAKIEGIGSNSLRIHGVEKLGGATWEVIPDHLDVGGLIAAAVMTGGSITIEHAIVDHMRGIIQAYKKLGIVVEVDEENDRITVPEGQKPVIVEKVKGSIFDMKAMQWPFFPPDLVHTAVVLALKAEGQAMFHNLMYEYGFFFVQELAKMKANVILANPVTVITTGPTDFQPANLACSDIIQASYGLLLACLAAPGQSTMTAINPLFRRFPNFVEQFNSLGADLTLVD